MFVSESSEGLDPVNRFNHTSWVAIVTPTNHPKSARNRCVTEVFGGVYEFNIAFWIYCRCRGFCHRTESDLFFFLLATTQLTIFNQSTIFIHFYK